MKTTLPFLTFRFRTGLSPLVTQLGEKRSELARFESQIQEKKNELERSVDMSVGFLS